MSLAEVVQKIARRVVRAFKLLTFQPRPRGMVRLTMENAQSLYGSRADVTIHSFHREDPVPLIPPKHLPEDLNFSFSEFQFPKLRSSYSAVLLDIRNPNFTFQQNHLIDDERRVLYEPKVRFEDLPISHQFLVPTKKIQGTVAYLSNTLFCHYGHWLQTQLPLLLSYWETFGKENIDYYYIGDGTTKDFVEESLMCIGISKENIINFPCAADRSLISIKYRDPDHGFKMDGYTHNFLQRVLFQPRNFQQNGSAQKKLFVSRGNVKIRKELNLGEIKQALAPLGFQFLSMDGKTMQEEADIFGGADVIISVHGSALHNVIFSRPGTKVIEIFAPDYLEASNFFIANHSRCEYYYLIGEKTGDVKGDISISQRNDLDVIVNIEKLLKLCALAGVDQSN